MTVLLLKREPLVLHSILEAARTIQTRTAPLAGRRDTGSIGDGQYGSASAPTGSTTNRSPSISWRRSPRWSPRAAPGSGGLPRYPGRGLNPDASSETIEHPGPRCVTEKERPVTIEVLTVDRKLIFLADITYHPLSGPALTRRPPRCLDTAHGGPRRRARRIPRYHYIPHHCSTAPQLPPLVALSSRGPGALRPLVAVSNGGVFGGSRI